jgi:outer membrane protein assembly factor BamB
MGQTESAGTDTGNLTRRGQIRLWPGVATVALQWLARFAVPFFVPAAAIFGVLSGVVGGFVVLAWWVFFSRAPRVERWGAAVLMPLALVATSRVLDESVATAGMGMLFFLYAIPGLSLAFVVWAVASRRLPDGPRFAAMVATIVLACGAWTLVRSDGMTGDGAAQFAWRWTQTPEERFLAQVGDEPMTATRPAKATAPRPMSTRGGEIDAELMTQAEWPGFRGPFRNSSVPGVRIETDWSRSAPVEVWRRPIGPGVSSFAVHGDRLYTQEQRGDDEVVASYDLRTGEPAWRHHDSDRFWDSHAGAGPRSTPTLSGGRVYTFGATGILNAIDEADGALVWSRNAASDTDATVPGWGFASSPLVVGDVVIVAVGGAFAAYDSATGDLRWTGPGLAGGENYSSPHLLTIDGVQQVLLVSATGATSVEPASGRVLWEHLWPGAPIVQPAQAANGDVLISTAGASGALGLRRLRVARGQGGWTLEELWTSTSMKPYFNDFVVHDGHAFGFDGSILASVDLEDGARAWKGGRYGHGQLLLLPDQDLLLVLAERGDLVLVEATPHKFTELSLFSAIEGKTWNHPVLVDDLLLSRNDHEMVAFRLPLAGDGALSQR